MKLKLQSFIIATLLALIQYIGNSQTPYAKNITPISTKSVSFIDDLHGFMVGDRAKILYTADGGHTWDHYYTGVDKLYNKVKFFDQNLGVVLGADLTMFVTHDGGVSWQQNNSAFGLGATNDFFDIWFIDATTWFVIGDGGILKTTDGGASWLNTSPGGGGNHIAFGDNQTGYFIYAGGAYFLYKSTDGGSSWTPHYVSTITSNPNGLHFFDSNNGLLATSSGQILRTSDGGSSFMVVYNGVKALNDFAFSNSQDGYCVGIDGLILKTADAGLTWTVIPGPTTIYDLYAAHMQAGNNAEFYGDYGLRIRTGNGISASLESEWPIEKSSLFGVAFHDENNGIVGGYRFADNKGIILRTTDGGGTWTRSTCTSTDIEYRNFHYINSAKVYALADNPNSIGTNGVFVSNDSGKTFSAVTVPFPVGPYPPSWNEMINFGQDTLMVIGSTFDYSYDGGTTWTQCPSYLGGYDITMIDSQTGFAASGAGGGIDFTNDRGNTISNSAIPTSQAINTVDYGTAATIYAAGDFGNIFKTANGGGLWNSIRSGTSDEAFRKIDFSDANTGFIIGGKTLPSNFTIPYILYTNNGGLSFQQIQAPSDFNFYGNSLFNLQMLTATTGFVVGESSNLIKICPTCSNQTVTVGMNDIPEGEEHLTLYPNPSSGYLYIKSSESFKTIGCSNYLGQSVAIELTDNNSINISSLSKGIYFLSMTTNDGTIITKKFIKQ